MLPLESIDADANNRPIDEHDEAFSTLVDSIRVLGVLDPIQLRVEGERYQLIDGERRWRAARAAGLAQIPCYVWGEATDSRDTLIAGVVLNEQRQAHRCIHVARRLREIKLKNGFSGEQVAAATGLPIDRVKLYLCLFNGSEFLLEFFAKHDVPLTVAAELIRYERATNEARARTLALRHLERPLTRDELLRLRRKETDVDRREGGAERSGAARPQSRFARQLDRAWSRDADATRAELEMALLARGYRLITVEDALAGESAPSHKVPSGVA
jgi:ParB/RepB/Spo0J family partition protein